MTPEFWETLNPSRGLCKGKLLPFPVSYKCHGFCRREQVQSFRTVREYECALLSSYYFLPIPDAHRHHQDEDGQRVRFYPDGRIGRRVLPSQRMRRTVRQYAGRPAGAVRRGARSQGTEGLERRGSIREPFIGRKRLLSVRPLFCCNCVIKMLFIKTTSQAKNAFDRSLVLEQ